MCKFHNNLFLVSIVLCSVWLTINASPIDLLLDELFEERDSNSKDYDLRYDQRQNGTENIRLNVDGVVIAYASGDSGAANGAGNLASEYLLQFADALDSEDDIDLSALGLDRSPEGAKPDDKKSPETVDQKKPMEAADEKDIEKLIQLRSNAPITADKDEEEPSKEHLRKRNK